MFSEVLSEIEHALREAGFLDNPFIIIFLSIAAATFLSGRLLKRRNRSQRPHYGNRSKPKTLDPQNWQQRRPYPGDYHGSPDISYEPHHDQYADPGEVVWSWVPYREDHSQGKDRPVLLIGRDKQYLLAVMMSSKSHDSRYWLNIGTGPWDKKRRESEVLINRIIRVHPADVRRIGARMPRDKFDYIAAGIKSFTN